MSNSLIEQFEYTSMKEIQWIKDHLKLCNDFSDFQESLTKIISDSECILNGHFELLSGKHSRYFLRFSRITRRLSYYKPIAKKLTDYLKKTGIKFDALLSPDTAGSTLAYGILEEYENDDLSLFISKTDDQRKPTEEINFIGVKEGTPVVIVNDMTTTGTGVKTLCDIATKYGCEVKAVVLFARRNPIPNLRDIIPASAELIVMCDLDFAEDTSDKKECPLCPNPLIKSYLLN
jgi:orotate phosphoribosyltransferase